ncbi:GNAT family N-acetyltransferase [Flavobacterium sp. LS1R49]|uniref:GNAT family N-acetyltransferase n=1 Tax=Flavobacterium shii TaxID=2987687 RepID=A0A9X3C6V5_9FLAO|nr:GNAT family N-acetyltransferase [Flavobacterium shii]MCV9930297.1 GNAT family N-acetyltransferase [Flavobacterium shii]
MIIRKATIKDAEYIATYLLLAMEGIVYKFIKEENHAKAKDFLLYFIEKENNQYSYENCFVVEDDNEIVAAVNIYDGAELKLLREPIVQYVRTHFNKDFNPEDETQAGEYYIDTLGVSPKCQGKGIGSKILQFLIDEYANKKQYTLGLLVEEENPNAKKLYLKLGFKPVGNKTLAGKKMEHLQIKSIQ